MSKSLLVEVTVVAEINIPPKSLSISNSGKWPFLEIVSLENSIVGLGWVYV